MRQCEPMLNTLESTWHFNLADPVFVSRFAECEHSFEYHVYLLSSVSNYSYMLTIRQQFLKTVYPAYVRLSRVSKNKARVLTNTAIIPPVSFYSLYGELRDGKMLDFKTLKGKQVLLVNTASGCGFTEQYDQLQKLFKQYNNELVVLAFPTNDFGEERNSDEEIAIFCKENFRVSFPLMKKSVVKKGRQQNTIFQWLTDAAENGWNSQAPGWNFCKYLVNEQGTLTGYFGSAIEPLGKEISSALAIKHF